MTPDLGQGAGQALEDAAALHRHLRGAEDLPAALRAFEAERAARVAPIVRASRRFGAVAQAKDPRLVGLRDALLGLVPAALQRRMLARLVRGGAA
jgi:2-polyprenyl-6-methoxyphenol hydroxylase-like FAD-dependent oxidoreductase